MFDARYHALSLVAVLIALAVGLLLGVAIGDSGLVSSAREDVEDSLRGDVRAAQAEADGLRDDLAVRRSFEERAYPALIADRLPGARVGLVFLGEADDAIGDSVREALEGTGGELRSVAVLRRPPDLEELAGRSRGSRYVGLRADPDSLLGPFGERIGRQWVEGGQLVERVRPALTGSFSGDLTPLDAIVVARAEPAEDRPQDEAGWSDDLEDGFVEGLAAADRPVVGVERGETDPSQVAWYRDRDLTSVDDVDDIAGRAALVFALAGAEGAFGTKDTAEAILPATDDGG